MTESTPTTTTLNRISYSDYDPRDGPIYVIEANENDDAWIQSTHPIDVKP